TPPPVPSRRRRPGLGGRADHFGGDPAGDAFGVRGGQPEDDVAEAGGGGLGDRVPGGARVLVGDRQDDGAGDRGGIAADLGAQAVEQGAAGDGVLDVA